MKTTLKPEVAKEIAQTIAQQMGGTNRLSVMVGANNFLFEGDGTFRFNFKMSRKASLVRIELNGLDLYDVIFYKKKKQEFITDYVVTKEFKNVYADQLKPIFEEFTGLYLSL